MTWEGGEENYNVFRWYRAGWSRYTQPDPANLLSDPNLFAYGRDNSLVSTDRLGLWCGSGWNEKFVPDSLWSVFGKINLAGPCQNHDECYSACGANKAACDWGLYTDISKECLKVSKVLYVQCKMVAAIYQTAVHNFGQGAFDDAQKGCTKCKKPLPPMPPVTPKPPSLGDPKYWSASGI
jgi:hypothetical protein